MNETLSHGCILSFKTPTPHLSCLAISHSGFLYAAASHEISVFDLSTSSRVDSFNGHATSTGFVKSIVFDGCGRSYHKVFTAHQDGKIRVWEVLTGPSSSSRRHRLLQTLPTFADRLLHFASPRNYVSVRRHKKRMWIEHSDAVSGLAVSRNKGVMYSVSWDRSFKMWNTMDNMRCLESMTAHEDAINAVVASDISGTVYTASADGLIRVWAKDEKQRRHTLINTLEKHTSSANTLTLNNDESMLYSGGGDHQIMVWQRDDHTNQMAFLEALRGHTGAVLCLITVYGDLLVSGSSDRSVRIWRRGKCAKYSCLGVIEGHERPIKSLVTVPTETSNKRTVTICSGSLDGEIKLWEISI